VLTHRNGKNNGNAVCPFLRCQRPWSASGWSSGRLPPVQSGLDDVRSQQGASVEAAARERGIHVGHQLAAAEKINLFWPRAAAHTRALALSSAAHCWWP
jgi:hypothetical protein